MIYSELQWCCKKVRKTGSHIEFCDYDKGNCPFPDHCKICDEVEAEMNGNEESTRRNINDDLEDDELPF